MRDKNSFRPVLACTLAMGATAIQGCMGASDYDTETSDSVVSCGDNTTEVDGVCVGDCVGATCGDNTTEVDGVCIGVACGDNTTEVDGVCVGEVGAICGENTSEVDGVCVGVACGEGTVEEDGLCVTVEDPWESDLNVELGVWLDEQRDSSGADAWDPVAHPLVFVTTTGPGYGGLLGGSVVWPGLSIIDADTHELVAYQAFDMSADGWPTADVFEPHGLAVSPDGQWFYLPTGNGRDNPRLLIINARTLKIDKILRLRGRPHHGFAFADASGNDRVAFYGWEQPPFVMDPADDNRVVGGVSYNESGIEGYIYSVTPDGTQMWGSGRWRKSNVKAEMEEGGPPYIEGQLFFNVDTSTWKLKDHMPFPYETTPIWIEFTPDDHYVYVSGGHSDSVIRYDRTNTTDGPYQDTVIVNTGVSGPYGIRFNWDGTKLYVVEKHEGGDNLGSGLGIIDMAQFEDEGYVGTRIETGCIRGDHGSLHPDPDVNELWISCNSSFEILVWDMATDTEADRIPMPDSGSTHTGAFVQYASDFSGEVLSDNAGLHGAALAEQLALWQY